jgi:hypothetical protein
VFLTELRSRIATQPLPYQDVVEARALESRWEVFAQARAAIKKYPGCEQFADFVTDVLNMKVRPVTRKWHRAREQGRLNSRDDVALAGLGQSRDGISPDQAVR